jgi:aminomethyltransferase
MAITAEHQPGGAEISESRRQMTALVSGCGIYRLERALFSLTGRDRVRWLNGMVSNNVRDLAAGQGVYAFVLNAQGQIQGDLYAFHRGESLVLEIERSQVETLLPQLRRYIIMDKVEVEDLSGKTAGIGMAGPQCRRMLGELGLQLPELEALQLTEASWRETPITVVRGDNPSVENYEIWLPAEQREAAWEALVEAGAVATEAETLETFRILCGIPKFGQDIRERVLPQETGQDRALNFTKGCYIGQEIVERIRARGSVHRKFVGFEVEGAAPPAGTKVQHEGKDVGEITSVMAASLKQKRLALGFMRREVIEPGRTFTAGEATVTPVSLPFTGIFH